MNFLKLTKVKMRRVIAISVIWLFVSLPLSELVYYEVFGKGFYTRIFCLLALLSPIWLYFGWLWLMDQKKLSRKMLVGFSALYLLCSYSLAEERLGEIAFIPVLCLGVIFALRVAIDGFTVPAFFKKFSRKQYLLAGLTLFCVWVIGLGVHDYYEGVQREKRARAYAEYLENRKFVPLKEEIQQARPLSYSPEILESAVDMNGIFSGYAKQTTDAQRDNFIQSAKGKIFYDKGYVTEVKKNYSYSFADRSYSVRVLVERKQVPGRYAPHTYTKTVSFSLTGDQALELNKNDEIRFAGVVTQISKSSYSETVNLDKVVINPKEE